MRNDVDYAGYVRKAQLGDRESVERLSVLAEKRLRVDAWRLTLDKELAEEIVQESLVEMLKMLKELKEANRFWPWLYKIVLNKIRGHYRRESYRKTVPLSAATEGARANDDLDGMATVMSNELKEIVVGAMRSLKPNYRTVLTMRCYREMGYSEIAEAVGCSEFAAKMTFYRAKKSLKKQLVRYGFGKGSLLMALVVFGKLTSGSEAAAAGLTVSASSLKVGAAAGMAALVTSKSVVIPVLTAGALATGTVVVTSVPERTIVDSGERPMVEVSAAAREESGEYWYYFPERLDGPVMMRMMKAGPNGGQYCAWRQNEEDNYYFERGENTIYKRNRRMWREDLRVWRLPTDGEEMSSFISQLEGVESKMEQFSDYGEKVLMIKKRGEEEESSLRVVRYDNMLEEEYFHYSFPVSARVVDERDAMHKRGWVYFSIFGELGGEEVAGEGRMPFVYGKSRRYSPWLRLNLGGREVVDESFVGFGRPWMGLHTIDTVRRDAAKEGIVFETRLVSGGSKVEVKLVSGGSQVLYLIDMERDIVDEIRVSRADGVTGKLEFEYLDEADETTGDFVKPRRGSGKGAGLFDVLWNSK
jgi:RNA polymerase sigma-70 factor (ECF subfamily)